MSPSIRAEARYLSLLIESEIKLKQIFQTLQPRLLLDVELDVPLPHGDRHVPLSVHIEDTQHTTNILHIQHTQSYFILRSILLPPLSPLSGQLPLELLPICQLLLDGREGFIPPELGLVRTLSPGVENKINKWRKVIKARELTLTGEAISLVLIDIPVDHSRCIAVNLRYHLLSSQLSLATSGTKYINNENLVNIGKLHGEERRVIMRYGGSETVPIIN